MGRGLRALLQVESALALLYKVAVETMKRHLTHPRDEIMRTMERIYRYRMTTTSGGNLSIREPSGDIWITPARLDKGSLRREDVVCVNADGSVEVAHRP